MKVYKLNTNIFRYFSYGDILYPFNSGHQYAKEGALPADPCIDADIIKRIPEYFTEIDLFDDDKIFNDFIKRMAEELLKLWNLKRY